MDASAFGCMPLGGVVNFFADRFGGGWMQAREAACCGRLLRAMLKGSKSKVVTAILD